MRCEVCGGDGSIQIDPIEEAGGVTWTVIPCEECCGTGKVEREEIAAVALSLRANPLRAWLARLCQNDNQPAL